MHTCTKCGREGHSASGCKKRYPPALLLAVLVAALVGPAAAIETNEAGIALNADERAACAAEGGCVVHTMRALQILVRRAMQAGASGCGNNT